MDPAPQSHLHEPHVTVFYCENGCGENPLRHGLPLHCQLVRCCASEVSVERLHDAFAGGADGVLILGCVGKPCCVPPDDMAALRHLHEGNMAMHRLGLSPARLQRRWLMPREAPAVPAMIAAFRRRVAALGPRGVVSVQAPEPLSASSATGA